MRVLRSFELTDTDWALLAGTPLMIQMLHNCFYIEDHETLTGDEIEEMGLYFVANTRGLWHAEMTKIKSTEASGPIRVAFELLEDCEEVAAWVKLRFEGKSSVHD